MFNAEQELALEELKEISHQVSESRKLYARALDKCRNLGLTNTTIARSAGKTEAAIRMHFGRRSRKW